jgi:hypothetical protein
MSRWPHAKMSQLQSTRSPMLYYRYLLPEASCIGRESVVQLAARVLVQRLRDQEAHAIFEGIAAGIEGRTARGPTARPAPAPAGAQASMGVSELYDPVDLFTLPTFEEYR